jgi:predicted AlkP superfamily phosphohydrolase/phosphomutase
MDGRVVIIGLDGATWTLLDKYVENGDMPNLAAVREQGTSGVLKSTVPPSSIPAWPSMVTGKNPGKHGIFDFTQGPNTVTDTTPVVEHGPWHLYDNRTMAFINVPGTYGLVDEPDFDGYVVSGLFTPSDDWESPDEFASPDAFGAELDDLVDEYHIDLWGKDEHKLLERAEAVVDQRTATMLHVLQDKDVDLFWGVYVVPDRLLHRFWAYQDPDHPLYDGIPDDDERRDALRNHFRQLDDALGEIRDALDEDDVLLIVSDHGFQPLYRLMNIDRFLDEQGYMERTEESSRSLIARLGLTQQNAIKLFERLGGEWLLDRTSKRFRLWLKQVGNSLPSSGDGEAVDRESSPVLLQNNRLGITVNTASQGGPVPDAEREQLAANIAADLRDFMDTHGFDGYVKTRETFLSGPHTDDGPDVCFFLEQAHPWGSGEELVVPTDTEMGAGAGDLSAWHHPDGIYVVTGPGIAQGEQDASIYDVLPTAMHILGGKVDADGDGQVMDIFTDGSRFDTEPEQVTVDRQDGGTVSDIDI